MTSLRGNLNTVDLANILQMLQMNQRDGTLHIIGPEGRRAIHFGSDGVTTLNCGPRRHGTLGRILVSNGWITNEQLTDALRRQTESTGRMLGQILVEQGLVTREQIEDALRMQVEEEIYDLFISKDAQFEFVEGELSEELSGQRSPNRIAVNVNSLIMEAAQRIDEWEWIRGVVDNPRVIYRYSGVNVPLDDPIFSEPAGGRVLTVIDGRRDVDDLIEDSCAGRFQVCKVLALLLQAGALEMVSPTELREEALAAVATGDTAATIKFLKRLVELHADDPDTHRLLAEAYEGERELAQAAFHYRVYAEVRVDGADIQEAFRIYDRIQEILPTDLAATDRMIEIFAMNPDGLEDRAGYVISAGKSLADVYVDLGRSSRAIQVLHRVVSLGPDDADLRSRLIDVYLATGMSGEAVAEYEALAETALAVQDYARAEQIYRKVLTIAPGRDDVLSRLNQLISRKTQRRRSVRNSVTAAGLVTVLGVAGWYGLQFWLDHRADQARGDAQATAVITDLRSRHAGLDAEIAAHVSAIAASRGDEDALLREIRDRREERAALERRGNQAMREFVASVEEYSGTTGADDAAESAAALRRLLKELSAVSADGVERLAVRAQGLYLEGRALANGGGSTRDQFAKFDRAMTVGMTSAAWMQTPDGAECQAYHASLRDVLGALEATHTEVAALLAEGDTRGAFDRALGFFDGHPPPDLAIEVRVPIEVDSMPRGAAILLRGEDTGLVTPAVVNLSIRAGAELTLHADGFDATPLTLTPIVESDPRLLAQEVPRRLECALVRHVAFVSDPADSMLEASPGVIGDLVIVPTRSERVDVLRRDDGVRTKPLVLRNPSGSVVRPIARDGVVAIAAIDGFVYFHDLAARRFLGAYEAPGEIRTDPLLYDSTLVLATQDGRVIGVDMRTRNEVWRYPARGAAPFRGTLLGGLRRAGDRIAVATDAGEVVVLDPDSGSAISRIELRTFDEPLDPVHGIAADATHVVAASTRGKVVKIDHRSGEIAWSVSIAVRPAAAPQLHNGRAVVVGEDGRVVVLAVSEGSVMGELDLGARPAGETTLDGDTLLVADDRGRLWALDVTDGVRRRWRHDGAGGSDAPVRITTRPAVHGDLVLFGAADGRVRAVVR